MTEQKQPTPAALSICERVAKYAHDCTRSANHSLEWGELDLDERERLINEAWRAVFDSEREWRDPAFVARGLLAAAVGHTPARTRESKRYSTLDGAKIEARAMISDKLEVCDVYEVLERRVTGFYRKVAVTVEEE